MLVNFGGCNRCQFERSENVPKAYSKQRIQRTKGPKGLVLCFGSQGHLGLVEVVFLQIVPVSNPNLFHHILCLFHFLPILPGFFHCLATPVSSHRIHRKMVLSKMAWSQTSWSPTYRESQGKTQAVYLTKILLVLNVGNEGMGWLLISNLDHSHIPTKHKWIYSYPGYPLIQ